MSTFSVVTGKRFVPSIAARPSSPAPMKSPVELTLDALEGRHRALIVWHLFWGARPFSDKGMRGALQERPEFLPQAA